jgi:hypothetical protein
MCSDYYCWCLDQGYPELDVRVYSDGSWGLIQYLNTPIMPSRTRFIPMLLNIKHQEISPSFIKHHADRLNLQNRAVWDEQDRTERRALEEVQEQERRAEDFANQMMKGVRGNDALMQRIARNGLSELNPMRMLNHISPSKLGGRSKGYREN